jgi:hypothetical protein
MWKIKLNKTSTQRHAVTQSKLLLKKQFFGLIKKRVLTTSKLNTGLQYRNYRSLP